MSKLSKYVVALGSEGVRDCRRFWALRLRFGGEAGNGDGVKISWNEGL